MRIVTQVNWPFIISLFLSSCGARQIPLTDKEIVLAKNVGFAMHADVKFQYDYDAVSKSRKTGNFILLVTQNERGILCKSDSLFLKNESYKLASVFLPATRFRENHNRFTIMYSTVKTDGNFEERLCHITYSASTNQKIGQFKVRED